MAINLKKKPGRPKKNPVVPQVDYKEVVGIKDQIISDLEIRLDDAYKEQEQMLIDLSNNLERVKYHCRETAIHAGEITLEDVYYSVELLQRIMNNKFGYKSTDK